MKIGILTYHSSHNYGAFLQAYALAHALMDNTGNQVEIINFTMLCGKQMNKEIVKFNKNHFASYLFNLKKYNMFESSLHKYLPLSDTSLVTDDIRRFSDYVNGKYDAVIVGSDEVWKTDGYRGFPNPYWLPGIKECKKLAYAVSSRTLPEKISPAMRVMITGYLKGFSYIGVRDMVTKRMLEGVLPDSSQIMINCDPTFAYNFQTSADVGKRILREKFHVNRKKKCIALMCGVPELAYAILKTYGESFEFVSLYDYYWMSKGFSAIDPFEWMSVIAGVDGLITTFFHGMVFAIKNDTPFLAIENRDIAEKEYSKSYDLLKRNNLEANFSLLGDPMVTTCGAVGTFLAKILEGSAQSDFKDARRKERSLFVPFLNNFPDLRPKPIQMSDRSECCGCGACAAVCTAKAITMQIDKEGFAYPQVDPNRCVECGLCRVVCVFNDHWMEQLNISRQVTSVYGAKHKDEKVRAASRSGGIFTALSDAILDRGGIVYGVAFDENFLAVHRRATTKQERDAFRGSKYIQSDMMGVYETITDDIRSGKPVLFSGTSCQVAAIKSYLNGEDCERLICVDIICHGVPSPKIWRDYLSYLETKYKEHVTAADFRNKKKYGWTDHIETVKLGNLEIDGKLFTQLFHSHKILRPACYQCPYKDTVHPGDITIGDYWGIDKAIPGFNDNKGVSLILLNSEKGRALFNRVQSEVEYAQALLADSMQNSMIRPCPCPAERDEFWAQYQTGGFLKVVNAYQKKQRKIAVQVKTAFVKRKVKNIVKTILHKG